MLQEIESSRQDGGAQRRRWFQDADMDLFFWSEPGGSPQRFELSLRRRDQELAVSWTPAAGCRAARIDEGGRPGGHARAPLLIGTQEAVDPRLAEAFAERSGNMDPAVAGFVAEALASSRAAPEPTAPPPPPATHAPSPWSLPAVVLLVLTLLLLLGLALQ